jgi:PAS domain S-box-containing protein
MISPAVAGVPGLLVSRVTRAPLRRRMSEVRTLRHRLVLEALVLGNQVERIHDALEQLRRLSELRLRLVRPTPEEVEQWLRDERFRVQDSGFYRPDPPQGPPPPLAYTWGASFREAPGVASRFFSLRDLGPDVRTLHDRLPGVAWFYYQDVGNASFCHPWADPVAAGIPPTFDWHQYAPFLATEPGVNPEGRVRWTPPTIDYGGEGLITIASIPVHQDGCFVGIWSIDVPLRTIHGSLPEEPMDGGQVDFLCDGEGNLITHPSLHTEVDKAKGAIYRKRLADMGGDFASLVPAELLRRHSGELRLRDAKRERLVCLFHSIEHMGWLLFTTFPEAGLTEEVQRRFHQAFEHISAGDLSHRLRPEEGHGMRGLAEDYNRMAEALQAGERQRSAERARADAMLRAVGRSAMDAIVCLDGRGRVLFWSRGAERVFGVSEQEMLGRTMEGLFTERFRESLWKGLQRMREVGTLPGVERTVGLEARRADGLPFKLELSLTQWVLEGQPHFTGVFREVFERKSWG